MFNTVYNLMLIGYIGYAIYVLSEPWHDEIGGYLHEIVDYVRKTYARGKFVIEASVDTQLIMKGM